MFFEISIDIDDNDNDNEILNNHAEVCDAIYHYIVNYF